MICPVKLTHEMSDLSGGGHSIMTGCGHEADEPSRGGAGDETTGRHVTSHGEADHVVSAARAPTDQLTAFTTCTDARTKRISRPANNRSNLVLSSGLAIQPLKGKHGTSDNVVV